MFPVYFWQNNPLVRVFLPFAAGIVLALMPGIPLWLPVWPLAAAVSLLLLSQFFRFRLSWIYPAGVFIQLGLLALGCQLGIWHDERLHPSHFITYGDSAQTYYGCVKETPVDKAGSYRVFLDITAVNDRPARGQLMVYLRKSAQHIAPEYGDVLMLHIRPEPVKPPQNPGAFDYKAYLAMKNVFYSAYADSLYWVSTGKTAGNGVIRLAYTLRDSWLESFRKYVPGQSEAGMAGALLFGYRQELDPELVDAYAHTGTLHVLAVSGMHVGLIYLVFTYMLIFLNRNKWTRTVQHLLILVLLWFYAFVTGFSPSVFRATLMFSLVLLGKATFQHTSIYNILAGSALVILIVDPFLLFDVGLQLSYLAVLGIVVIQPKLAAIWSPGNWLLRQAWALTSVSIAAQITTLPLSLYVFHQFPVYFIPANLTIIPLTTALVYIALLLLCFTFWPWAATWLGKLTGWLIGITNDTVRFIDSWPGSVIAQIPMSLAQVLLLAILVGGLVYWIYRKKTYALLLMMGIYSVVMALHLVFLWRSYQQRQLVVWQHRQYNAISVSGHRNISWLADEGWYVEMQSSRHAAHNYCREQGIRIRDTLAIQMPVKGLRLTRIGNDWLAVADSALEKHLPHTPLSVRWLVLTPRIRMKPEALLTLVKTEILITNGVYRGKSLERWKAACSKEGIEFYAVSEQGAYLCNW